MTPTKTRQKKPVEAKGGRTEKEYRELIGLAVFWLARWPTDKPLSLRRDLNALSEIVLEDAEEANRKLTTVLAASIIPGGAK